MKIYGCYNRVIITASGAVFGLVRGCVHVFHRQEWIRNMVWCYVAQLNMFYYCYFASTSIHPTVSEWSEWDWLTESKWKSEKIESDKKHRYRSWTAQWSDPTVGWGSWTTVKTGTGQPSLFGKPWLLRWTSSSGLWEERVSGNLHTRITKFCPMLGVDSNSVVVQWFGSHNWSPSKGHTQDAETIVATHL